jgi:hypothetical protein
MTADIIDLGSRRQAKTFVGTHVEPPLVPSSEVLSIFSDKLFRLPFVTLPAEECADWGEFWDRTTMWNDEPTEDGGSDYRRGRRYAREAVAAIVSDKAIPRGLELVVNRMIKRAFSRRGPAGRICRQLSSAEDGFLRELCLIAVEAVRQKGMPT